MSIDVMTRKVLLLNASFEPLGVIGIPRAIRLVWKQTAEVIELDGDRVLRSPRFAFPVPSVIRLVDYVDVRGRQSRSPGMRASILMRDRFRCQYCGMKGSQFELTLDHIMPRSRGGRTTPENLCAACKACNQRKGDRTPEEARMPLLANPSALRYGLDRAAVYYATRLRPEWRKYVFLGEQETGVA
ncbi:MAG TPA: HNH endonuclease [Blastocatellia bacterium]|jgi:5-methylcytosine-specific restriction endonuclease McrA